mgnify:FL=1
MRLSRTLSLIHCAYDIFGGLHSYAFFVGSHAPCMHRPPWRRTQASESPSSDQSREDIPSPVSAVPVHSTPVAPTRRPLDVTTADHDVSFLERLIGPRKPAEESDLLLPRTPPRSLRAARDEHESDSKTLTTLRPGSPFSATPSNDSSQAQSSPEPVRNVLPVKRGRGRPRKDGAPPVPRAASLSRALSADRESSETVEDAPKRKRGRPRKLLEPHEEYARIASKQAASIPLWRVEPTVDRPPQYPETHVFIRWPKPVCSVELWDSPVRPYAPASVWWHYRRPTLVDVPARRSDGLTAEPIPVAAPGRRARTRTDYIAVQHTQLANRARRTKLDVEKLWRIAAHRLARTRLASSQPDASL